MRKLICSFVIAIILLLAAATALAAPPGKGEITVSPGGAITSITVRYDLGSFMGEPSIKAAYKWNSVICETIDGNTGVWLKIQDNVIATNQAYIWVGDGVPGSRGEWSDDFTGSPGWDKVLVKSWRGNDVIAYHPADLAKQFWKNGFRVIDAELSRIPAAGAPQVQKFNPPGKGTINVNKPGGGVISFLGVRYNIDTLNGEPLVTAAYTWASPYLKEIDANAVVWLKIQDIVKPANIAFIRIGDVAQGKRSEWSQEFNGSSSWDNVLVQTWSGTAALSYVPAERAKEYWRNGFKVVGAEFSKKFDVDGAALAADPNNNYGQWSEWVMMSERFNALYGRIMCERFDAASGKYVWRLEIQNRSKATLDATVYLHDRVHDQDGPKYAVADLQPGATVEVSPTYMGIGRVSPGHSGWLVAFGAEPANVRYPQPQQPQPQPQVQQAGAKTSGSITIRPQDFAQGESSWSQSGPSYEGNENIRNYGATHTHVYGKTAGKFTYYFSLPSGKYSEGKLSARLSSEFPYFGDQTPKDGYSDVALYINNSFIGTKTVIPDNGSGAWYSWAVPAGILREGSNRIEFVVQPNGRYSNGLSIYEKSLTGNEQNAQIIVEFSRTY